MYVQVLELCKYTVYTLPFKRLGSFSNILFEIFCTLKYPIDQKHSVDVVNVVNDYCSCKRLILNGISTEAYRGPLSATITPVFQWHVVLANPSLSF